MHGNGLGDRVSDGGVAVTRQTGCLWFLCRGTKRVERKASKSGPLVAVEASKLADDGAGQYMLGPPADVASQSGRVEVCLAAASDGQVAAMLALGSVIPEKPPPTDAALRLAGSLRAPEALAPASTPFAQSPPPAAHPTSLAPIQTAPPLYGPASLPWGSGTSEAVVPNARATTAAVPTFAADVGSESVAASEPAARVANSAAAAGGTSVAASASASVASAAATAPASTGPAASAAALATTAGTDAGAAVAATAFDGVDGDVAAPRGDSVALSTVSHGSSAYYSAGGWSQFGENGEWLGPDPARAAEAAAAAAVAFGDDEDDGAGAHAVGETDGAAAPLEPGGAGAAVPHPGPVSSSRQGSSRAGSPTTRRHSRQQDQSQPQERQQQQQQQLQLAQEGPHSLCDLLAPVVGGGEVGPVEPMAAAAGTPLHPAQPPLLVVEAVQEPAAPPAASLSPAAAAMAAGCEARCSEHVHAATGGEPQQQQRRERQRRDAAGKAGDGVDSGGAAGHGDTEGRRGAVLDRVAQLYALQGQPCKACQVLLQFCKATGVAPDSVAPDLHARRVPDAATLTQAVQHVSDVLADLATDAGWQLVRNDELQLRYRHLSEGDVHAFRARCVLDAPVEHPLALAREVDLCPTWNKFCTSACVLREMSVTDVVVYMSLWVPWPLNNVGFMLEATGADLYDEEGRLVICFKSPDRAIAAATAGAGSGSGHTAVTLAAPPPPAFPAGSEKHRKIRLLPPSCMAFTPLPPKEPGGPPRVAVDVQTYVDPGLRHVPPFIISFVLKVLSPFVYGAVRKVLASAFKSPANPLPKRIQQRMELYGLVRRRTEAYLKSKADAEHGTGSGGGGASGPAATAAVATAAATNGKGRRG